MLHETHGNHVILLRFHIALSGTAVLAASLKKPRITNSKSFTLEAQLRLKSMLYLQKA